jgi:diguanylate cyclase (GGDEF)-like protein
MQELTETRMPLDDLMVFHKLARSLTSSLELDAILRTILDQMDHFVDAGLWALLLVDLEHRDLYYALASDGQGNALKDLRVRIGEGLAGWVAEHGETLIIPEAASDTRLSNAAAGPRFTVRSAIGLPIRGSRGTHGVLEIFNPDLGTNPDYTIAFLHILADYAAIAIENAQDVARAQQLTITDDVTGLYNARHLYKALETELAIARRDATSLSLVFLDLDRFKVVNDFRGHLIGSELLGEVGKRLSKLCRPCDLCFRYGGDEFVILMPQTSKEEAFQRAHDIHHRLSSAVFKMANGLELSVSSSAGIASYPADGRTVHAILGAADKRMYAVKGSGRGRVEG